MLGDSITNGCEWSELLSTCDVVNRGIGGDATAGILNRIDQIITLKPKKVFLMVGINDLGKEIPVSKILSNYQDIITKLLAENIEVFVQSTLNVGKIQLQRNLQVTELNRSLKTYCSDHGVTFIDLNRTLAPDGFLLDKYSNEGLHLTGDGYIQWRDEIAPFLQ
ncbi:MAG: GDSL-type esterase/lipase family protein [Deltaproteobacteria bacterium]|nr:GDSL-type esterase/lipase family protein [Deltaproteobacteria bacterium]